MNDTELTRLWTALEPNGQQRARIEDRVFEWIEARETSILGEWLALIRIDPIPGFSLAAAAALALLLFTPLKWVAYSILS